MSASGNDGKFEKLNALLLRHFSTLVGELGGNLDALLAKAGIAAEAFDSSADLTYRQAIILLETAAVELTCKDFGMRLAARQRGGSIYGPLGFVMSNSEKFGDALHFAREHSNAHSSAARVWLKPESDGYVFAGHELLLGNLPNRAQAMEQVLLIGHLQAVDMTGGYTRSHRVDFRHEPVSAPHTYRRYFGCEVRFGEQADGIVFAARDLANPIVKPSAQIRDDTVSYIERKFPRERLPFNAELRALIVRRLGFGGSSSDELAKALSIHVRTLRRRLKEEGSSFRDVKDEVRRDLTLYYLGRTELDVGVISERLGFAEQSVLSRRCVRWFGKSPRALRRELMGQAGKSL